MPGHERTETVYYFDELPTEEAKEKAREWYREGNLDYEWWDVVYEDFIRVAEILGITIRTRQVPLMGGKTAPRPEIWFSLNGQGSGAVYEGDYRYRAGWRRALKKYAPTDEELYRIGKTLEHEQRDCGWKLTAAITANNRFYNRFAMRVDVDDNGYTAFDLATPLGDLADWLHKQLQTEWDYQNANEQVDESIRGNEYEFYENGRRA